MKRWQRWTLGGLAGLAVVALGAGLAGTAPVLGWAAARAGWQLEGVQGSLWTGLDIAQVRHQSASLTVEGQALRWAPWRWQDGALQGGLTAQRLHVRSAPSNAPTPTPEALLRALDWPVAVSLDTLRVADLQVQGLAFQGLDAGLRAGGSTEALSVKLRHLGWAAGQLQVAGELAFARDAQLRARLRLQGPRALVEAQGLGPITRWPLAVSLTSPDGAQAQLNATLQPLAAPALLGLNARFEQLDLQALHPQAPRTRWSGSAGLVPQEAGAFDLTLEARNALALRLDEGGWPLRELSLRLQAHPAHWQRLRVDALRLQLGNARQAAGELNLAQAVALPQAGQALSVPLRVQGVQLPRLDAGWPALQLDGRLLLTQAQAQAEIRSALGLQVDLQTRALAPTAQSQAWRLTAQADLQGQALTLHTAQVQQTAGPGRAQLSGRWTGLPQGWSAQGQGSVAQWPLRWGDWTGVVQAQGEAQLGWQAGRWLGQARLTLDDGARLADLPVLGRFDWTADAQGRRWQADLRLPHPQGDTEVHAQAAAATPLRDLAVLAQASSWRPQDVRWQAPALGRLQALWQPWLQQLSGSTEGQASFDADGWPLRLRAQALQWRWQPRADAAPQAKVPAAAPMQLAEARLDLAEGQASWRLLGLQARGWQVREAQGQGGRDRPWRWWAEGHAPGSWEGAPLPPWRWEGESAAPTVQGDTWRLAELGTRLGPIGSEPWLRWRGAQLAWSWRTPFLRLDGGQLTLRDTPLARQSAGLRWNGDQPELDLQLEGRLQPASWLAVLQPEAGWQGDLVTDLQLAVRGPALDLRLARVSGDLRLDGQAFGLEKLQLALSRSSQGTASAQLDIGSAVLGQLQGQARTEGRDGALSGRLRASLPALHLLQPWLPRGLQLRGQAQVDATLSGSLAQAQLQGQGQVDIERLQHAASGLGGRNGRVRWRFDAQRLTLQEFALQGLGDGDTGGWLRGQGEWGWGATQPGARLAVHAEGFRLLNRFDRQLVTSGDVTLALTAQQLQLRGKVQADQGVFDISQGDAPSLDDDVTVVRPSVAPAARATASRWQRDVQLQFDLGQRLRVQGRGLASRLTGQLQLVEQGGKPAQWTGLVEMGGGRYKAYGQTLDIESGELRFTGALDNPRLDILALRPDLEVRVGVRATGSAQTPRIRLYSEPDMADNDKLAWLLLGRAPDELGRNDTALLQRAALALLSGEGDNPATQLLDKLGLTEFSINNSDDAGTTLRLGAQLSRRWSVGYERSLNAATGSWQLVYRLGQRFRLRAQSGTDSALDALWLWRFD